MKKFTINAGTNSEYKVEAASYSLHDGYFHFIDGEKAKVFTISAAHVATIERESA